MAGPGGCANIFPGRSRVAFSGEKLILVGEFSGAAGRLDLACPAFVRLGGGPPFRAW
jgi:hypothetical protein